MARICDYRGIFVLLLSVAALPAMSQTFRVQCPTSTITHPTASANNAEPAYTAPTVFTAPTATSYQTPTKNVNGAIKCQQVGGGDGYATMADGTQTYMFSFGPLSGLADISNGLPAGGTQFPSVYNGLAPSTLLPGDPATTDGAVANSWPAYNVANPTSGFIFNGAVGLTPDADQQAECAAATGTPSAACAALTAAAGIDGHVDPRQIMDIGIMNGNIPAPLMSIDEDDEFFLTLTNVGMIMRPDLFEQHTIHFHGYPNASAFYDGVPDASVAINIGGSFTYYYLAPDAGTYFWHCHITPPEHLQMGMVGQLYVRPRQDRVPSSTTLYAALGTQQNDLRTACRRPNDTVDTTVTVAAVTASPDILCSNPVPAVATTTTGGGKYVYNDGDGSSAYDVEYPIQIHGFDPNFHFVGMTFNPEGFVDMKDKYFLMNGRSYPDTVRPGPQATQSSDGRVHYSQPLPSIINIPQGGRALLRLSDLAVTEYATVATMGVPMHVVGYNAKLLRDQQGNNMDYYTNSITIGGGESADVILDASDAGCGSSGCAVALYPKGSVFYVYTPQLDHLSNDAENFGGLMTEVRIN
jgi:FtsP/CotA-like multicopper oxidase with cupredoxin domain